MKILTQRRKGAKPAALQEGFFVARISFGRLRILELSLRTSV
jgi:hypothetical protein